MADAVCMIDVKTDLVEPNFGTGWSGERQSILHWTQIDVQHDTRAFDSGRVHGGFHVAT